MDDNNDNEQENHLDNSEDNIRQYIIAVHLLNKSFLYLLIARNSPLLDKSSETYHFVFDYYTKTIFQGIIPDIRVATVSIARKSQFKALQ